MVEKVPKKRHSLEAYSLTFSNLEMGKIKKTISPLKMLKVWVRLFKSGLS